jgi:hypothetical protein
MALLPIWEEGVLQIFTALKKNLSPWLELNPQPLGPVASTLTTTPPRWLWLTIETVGAILSQYALNCVPFEMGYVVRKLIFRY